MRLYQETDTRTTDQPHVGGINRKHGYVFCPLDPRKSKTPAITRRWAEFPLSNHEMTDDHGDLNMCYLGKKGGDLA